MSFNFPKHLIIIDVETTGTNPETSSIIQLGAVIFNKGGYVETSTSFNEYVLPYTTEWTDEAQRVHGITYGKIQEIGKPINQVLTHFEEWLKNYLLIQDIKPAYWLAQWSAGWDVNMLKHAYERAGKKFPFHYRNFDVSSIVRFELAKRKQLQKECGEHVCARVLNIKVEDTKLHDALYDATLSGLMLEKLI